MIENMNYVKTYIFTLKYNIFMANPKIFRACFSFKEFDIERMLAEFHLVSE